MACAEPVCEPALQIRQPQQQGVRMVGLVLQLLQGAASYRKREPSWTSELASKHVKRLVSVSLPSIPIHPSIHAPYLPIHPGNSWRQELCCSACCVVRCQHRELVCDSMIHPVCFAGSSPALRRNHADRWPYACGGRGA